MSGNTNRLPISVVILTNRADHQLRQCIQSVTWAKEIILVDNTPGTNWKKLKLPTAIALKILPHPQPISDFSLARNNAMKQATYDWILMIDSDEYFLDPVTAAHQISEMINHRVIKGYYLRRRDIFHDHVLKHGEAGSIKLIRLFQKNYTKFVRPIHEEAVVNGYTQPANLTLHHQSHQSLSDFIQTIASYAQNEAHHRTSNNKSFSLLSLLFKPLGKFGYNYIIKLGFLDGWAGLCYAVVMSIHSAAVRVGMYEFSSASR